MIARTYFWYNFWGGGTTPFPQLISSSTCNLRTCWPVSFQGACANISMDQNRELLFRQRPNAAKKEPRVNKECQWNLEAWGVRNGL